MACHHCASRTPQVANLFTSKEDPNVVMIRSSSSPGLTPTSLPNHLKFIPNNHEHNNSIHTIPDSDVKVIYQDNKSEVVFTKETLKNTPNALDNVQRDIDQLLCSLSLIRTFVLRRNGCLSLDPKRNVNVLNNIGRISEGDLEEFLYEPISSPSFISYPNEHYVVNEGYVAEINFTLRPFDYAECLLYQQTCDSDGKLSWSICNGERIVPALAKEYLNVIFNRSFPNPDTCTVNCLIFDVKTAYTGLYRIEASNVKGISVTAPFMLEIIESSWKDPQASPKFRCGESDRDTTPRSNSYEARLDLWPCLPIPSLFLFKDGMRLDHIYPAVGNFPIYPSRVDVASFNNQTKHVINPDNPVHFSPKQNSLNILRATIWFPTPMDLHPEFTSRFEGLFLCLAENRFGKSILTFQLHSAQNESEHQLHLVPSTKSAAIDSHSYLTSDTKDWFEIESPQPEVGVRESVVTRLLVIADQPTDSLREALDKEMPYVELPKGRDIYELGADPHSFKKADSGSGQNTPIKVVHERFLRYPRPIKTQWPKEGNATNHTSNYSTENSESMINSTDDEITSTTTNSNDDYGCSDTTPMRYHLPVKRNYYYYSSTRVDRVETGPKDIGLDSDWSSGDDGWHTNKEPNSFESTKLSNTRETNDTDSTSSSLPTISETSLKQEDRSATPQPSNSLATSIVFDSGGTSTDKAFPEEYKEEIKIYKRDAKNVIFMSCGSSPTQPGTSPKTNSPERTALNEMQKQGRNNVHINAPSKFSKARSVFESKSKNASDISSAPSGLHTRAHHNSVKWRQPPLMPVSYTSVSSSLLEKFNGKSPKLLTVGNSSVVDSDRVNQTCVRYLDSGSPRNFTPPLSTSTGAGGGTFSPLHSAASHYSDPLPNHPISTRIRYKNLGSSSPWPRRRFTTEIESIPSCESSKETPIQHCRVIQYSSTADISTEHRS